MKKPLFFALMFVMTLLSNNLKADNISYTYDLGGGANVKISAIENVKAVVVKLDNISKEEVTISLVSDEGTYFIEKVKGQPSFSKKYNLTNLEKGTYRLIVQKKATKTIQQFELTQRNVLLYESERKEKFLPTLNQNGSKLDVNVLLGKYSNIKVKIYDTEGRNVYNDINYVVLTLNKRYDLSQLSKGAYIVEVVAGDETQYFPIKL